MYIHNLNPIIFEFGILSLRWYSLAYLVGIIFGWWYGKKILALINNRHNKNFKINLFDDYITYVIISIIIGGRLGYVFFYNIDYFIFNPLEIFFIWKGGMSFHGGVLGIIVATIIFSKKYDFDKLVLLDVVSCVAPIGIFFGRLANFINGELYGKPSDLSWAVVFPNIDNLGRHPSQIYEAFLEGILLFIILNFIIKKSFYRKGECAALFLLFYSIFRIICELFREPDLQIGYILNFISMGSLLSFIMIILGIIMYLKIR
ncbi:MAG: prolipoprotein diacylglyceryl transferase [Candidatus Pelagibacter sp.]|nr:prolipoprotein diacylglyceryl transferase [Candidatus Pelagibacter sp.]OUW69443.1 MAG: prolipoprotein diacylglyceryl transferase [Candidatus Pelagibacter sp. TMED202]|tara:strand:- start:162 stop:941 length:780 start_codon:yes stop_codon:yes gene_type:complete